MKESRFSEEQIIAVLMKEHQTGIPVAEICRRAEISRSSMATPSAAMESAKLQTRRLKQAKREKRIQGPPPQPTLPAVRAAIIAAFEGQPSIRCPHCRRCLSSKNLPK